MPNKVIIIGAGPYGLSLAAHLRSRGIGFRIFGEPMGNWRRKMPRGMLLKSEGFASDLADPADAFTLGDFCAANGLPYRLKACPCRVKPLSTMAGNFSAVLCQRSRSG